MNQTLALKVDPDASAKQEVRGGNQILFRVTSLYGISKRGMKLPINGTESIDTGPITITLDPDGEKSCNLGIVNTDSRHMKVRYGLQAVFPALQELLAQEKEENSLLNPPRAVSNNTCTLFDDGNGFLTQGLVEFLPGSLWSGTKGG